MSGQFPDTGDDEGVSMGPAGLGVEHHWVDRLVVVAVAGEVDALTAPQLSAAIGVALAGSPAGLIIDLSQVDFLASAGLGLLIATHDDVTPDVRFGVVAGGVAVRRAITVLGLDSVLTLYRTVEDALGDLSGA
jgi:anti-sigma B factor antagonist